MSRLLMNCIGLAVILAVLVTPVIVRAEAADDSITVIVDGNAVNFTDIQPRIVEGRALVPIREVFEMMGFSVTWSRGTSSARIRNGDTLVTARIGEDFITVNGVRRSGDVPPQIYDGRFMIPLRLVAEATGKNVYWNGDTRTAYITSPPVVYERKLDFTYEMWSIFHMSERTNVQVFTCLDDLAVFISRYRDLIEGIRSHSINYMYQVDSFVMTLEQYTECFFYDHALVIILFALRTYAWPGSMESISESGTITIARMMYQPPLPTQGIDNSWASIIELRNDIVPDSFSVNYNDIWTADSRRGLDFIAHSTTDAPRIRNTEVNMASFDIITSVDDVNAFFEEMRIDAESYFALPGFEDWPINIQSYFLMHSIGTIPTRFVEFMEMFERYTEEFFEEYFLIVVYNMRAIDFIRSVRVEHIDESGNILFALLGSPPGIPGPGLIRTYMFLIELSNDHIPEEFAITTVWYWD